MKILHNEWEIDWRRCGFALVLLSLFLTAIPLQAENTMPSDKISIEEAFTLIGIEYGVHFNYDRAVVADVEVDYDSGRFEKMEDALQSVFSQTNLKYEVFDHRYVAVYRQDREGVESMKKMVSHFQEVISSSEEAYHRAERRVTPPLASLSIKDIYSKRIVFSVSGIVTDQDGEPLIGVNIQVKGSDKGTSTDFDGKFVLDDISENAVLVVSYVGYQTLELEVQGKQKVEIVMMSDSQLLDEVVVVGYGTQKKVNLTGSISVLDGKSLENRTLTNSSQALYGINGVYVNQAGGNPGNDVANINIRGIGSIGGSGKLEPLVLVDEVETNLQDVNPEDIESISVLKDAASTAIYGSRAANGVILIKTKTGQKDEALRVNYSAYLGSQTPTYLPDAVSNSAEFMKGYNQALINQGGTAYYSDDLIKEFENAETSILHPNTDWMKVLFGSAFMQEHNLRFSGGSERSTYNITAGFLDQDGVLKKMTGAKKYNLSVNINTEMSDRLGFNVRVAVNRWNITQPSEGISTAMNRIMRMVPVQPEGRMENGDWPDSWVLTPGQNSFQNPLVFKEDSYGKAINHNFLSKIAAHYDISSNLIYNIQGSINYDNNLTKQFMPVIWLHDVRTGERTRNPYSSVGVKTELNTDDQRLNFTHTVRWMRTIKGYHNINFLLGNSFEKFTSANRQARNTGYELFELDELSVGTKDPSVSGNSVDDRLISYFGRIQYDYRDRYLFEINSRYDGSSRFAKENRWSYFPSLSIGWRLSEEEFFKGVHWTDELKIRGSWGQIGNQEIGRFQYVNSVQFGYGYPFGGVYNGSGVAITQYKDPNIRWETTSMTDIGIDWTGFNYKMEFTFDYFDKTTDDILRGIAIPAQIGNLAGPTTNIATVNNKGFEVSLNYRNNIRNLNFNIGGYLSHVRNKVIDLRGEVIFSGSRITMEGHPIDSWYIYETDGLFQTEEELENYPRITNRVGLGDVKYVDRNNDGKIDGDDRYIAGNSFPDYTYGFNLNLDFKGVSLMTQWQGVQNIDVWWSGNLILPYNNGAGVTKEWLYNSWTPENPNARLPRLTTRHQYTAENFSPSDYWLQDASYLRLKNIQLRYDFNNISFVNIRNLGIYLNGQNLLTFSKMKDFDPEQDVKVEHINKYPSIKIVSAGIVVDF